MRLGILILLLGACGRLSEPPAAHVAAAVSADRLERTVRKLASFDTRHTALNWSLSIGCGYA